MLFNVGWGLKPEVDIVKRFYFEINDISHSIESNNFVQCLLKHLSDIKLLNILISDQFTQKPLILFRDNLLLSFHNLHIVAIVPE
jgi:hypothetical protein